jgi:hypothetical protein
MDRAKSEYGYADDDSTFPAYTDYINGLVGRVESWDAAGLEHDFDQGRETDIDMPQYPAKDTASSTPLIQQTEEGPAVLDLRSLPSSPNMVKLIPPEHVRPASLHGPSRSAIVVQAMTAAEMTRQKLLDAAPVHSEDRAAAAQSLHGYTPQRRSNSIAEQHRMLPRQAIHPTLVRSSSATDVDSHHGQLTPVSNHMRLRSDSPPPIYTQSSVSIQQPQQEHTVRPPAILSQQTAPPSSNDTAAQPPKSLPVIRPGDLLTDPRFSIIPLANRQTADSKLRQFWAIVESHPDPQSRQVAAKQISQGSMAVYRLVYGMLKRTQAQV